LFQYPSIRSLARHVAQRTGAAAALPAAAELAAAPAPAAAPPIAIVGMSGRFPGAAGGAELWELPRAGREGVSFFSRDGLRAAGVAAELVERPDYVPAWGALRDIELFAARFFGFSPREAEVLDPQQRLFLECAWEALEGAGHAADQFGGRIGVFAGAGMSSYA